MNTIKEAVQYVRTNFNKGCKCPVCKQTVKLYKRSLNSGMMYTMWHIFLEDKTGSTYIHVKDLLRNKGAKNSHDWTLLAHWGLLEPHPSKTERGKWKLTHKGIDFIMGRLKVPDAILMYNNQIADVKGTVVTTSFKEALRNKFNLDEAMATVGITPKTRRTSNPTLV